MQITDILIITVGLLLRFDATLPEALTAFGAYAPLVLNRALVMAMPLAVLLAFGPPRSPRA